MLPDLPQSTKLGVKFQLQKSSEREKKNPSVGFLLMLTCILGRIKGKLEGTCHTTKFTPKKLPSCWKRKYQKVYFEDFRFSIQFLSFWNYYEESSRVWFPLASKKEASSFYCWASKKKRSRIIQIREFNVFDDLKHAYHSLCLCLRFKIEGYSDGDVHFQRQFSFL